MTKSMTHLDVEDVLSSIRRLVADGTATPITKADGPPLFVLTPALRVTPGTDMPAIQEPENSAAPPFTLQAAPADLNATTMEMDAPDVVDDRIKAETPGRRLEPILLTERVTSEETEPDLDEADMPDPVDRLTSDEPDRHLLESRIAELERAVGRVEDEWEPDGSEPQEQHQPKLQFLKRYKDRFEVIDGDGEDFNDPAPVNMPGPGTQDRFPKAPPASVPFAFSHTPHPADIAPSDLPENSDHSPAGSDIVDRQDDFFVDEAVLRSMVSDIVREELQGRLGERITRNVRRMVRHEIEKALSLKALE
jgi:hypothetical protein